MSFQALGIINPVLNTLRQHELIVPTPVQKEAIPYVLQGEDLLVQAQTGSGKTAAFAVPIIQCFQTNVSNESSELKAPQCLVLAPTRELALQIAEGFNLLSGGMLRTSVITGGVKQDMQVLELSKGVDVVVATPGRLLDLYKKGHISFSAISYFVIDEADLMLDMGFVDDLRIITDHLPKQRQSLFFSATLPEPILKIAGDVLGDPKRITIEPDRERLNLIHQQLYYVAQNDKTELLTYLLKNRSYRSVLVFVKTKVGVDVLCDSLDDAGVPNVSIHANKSQLARQNALDLFKGGEVAVLVATDIASRGIDVSNLGLVVNYDLPQRPETFIHRIGRTGRADMSGVAISFCNVDEEFLIGDIQALLKKQISVVTDHPFRSDGTEISKRKKKSTPNKEKIKFKVDASIERLQKEREKLEKQAQQSKRQRKGGGHRRKR